MKLLVALRKEWLELVRSYRLLIALVILLLFGLMSPALAKFTPEILSMVPGADQFAGLIPEPTVMDAVGQYVKNISQFGIILALLLSMGAIATEKDKGTAAMILVKPMPRFTFLAGKFIALFALFTLSLLAAGLGAWYYTLVLFGAVSFLPFMAATGLMLLYLLVYVSITLFCSTLTKSAPAAGGIAFGVLILLGIVGSIPTLGQYLPAQVLNWGANLMLGVGEPAWVALGVCVGIITLSFTGAWLVFRRQEL